MRIRAAAGPWDVALECSEDATQGLQGYLMHTVSMDEASNLFTATTMSVCKSNSMKLKWHTSAVYFNAGRFSEMPTEEDPDNALVSNRTFERC